MLSSGRVWGMLCQTRLLRASCSGTLLAKVSLANEERRLRSLLASMEAQASSASQLVQQLEASVAARKQQLEPSLADSRLKPIIQSLTENDKKLTRLAVNFRLASATLMNMNAELQRVIRDELMSSPGSTISDDAIAVHATRVLAPYLLLRSSRLHTIRRPRKKRKARTAAPTTSAPQQC